MRPYLCLAGLGGGNQSALLLFVVDAAFADVIFVVVVRQQHSTAPVFFASAKDQLVQVAGSEAARHVAAQSRLDAAAGRCGRGLGNAQPQLELGQPSNITVVD